MPSARLQVDPVAGGTMKTYHVKELFYTLQGEGAQAGRPAVFCRFTGCNLWTGREADRAKAICQFCDTDFVGTDGPGGGSHDSPDALAQAARDIWQIGSGQAGSGQAGSGQAGSAGPDRASPFVVCTGGEPLLQLDQALIAAFHDKGFEVAVETNGTIEVPESVDWICVSPKAGAPLVQTRGHELKLVYPQDALDPASFEDLDFERFYLQPMAAEGKTKEHTRQTIRYCLEHPRWRLSLQMHKLLGLP